MKRILENQIFRNLLSAVVFGVIYSILSYVDKGYVEIGTVLTTMALYFLFMCILYFIVPKLRKMTGHGKKSNLWNSNDRKPTKECDCMTKKSRIAICAVFVILGVAIFLVLTANRGNVSNVNRIVGYSALYDETSINEAFDVIEKKFAKDFEGCTLTELRYDEDVENRFAEEIEKYHKENNQELIVVLSTFDTDEKGGDGGFDPNDTYADWQWHLVKTADKKSWEIINWGY